MQIGYLPMETNSQTLIMEIAYINARARAQNECSFSCDSQMIIVG